TGTSGQFDDEAPAFREAPPPVRQRDAGADLVRPAAVAGPIVPPEARGLAARHPRLLVEGDLGVAAGADRKADRVLARDDAFPGLRVVDGDEARGRTRNGELDAELRLQRRSLRRLRESHRKSLLYGLIRNGRALETPGYSVKVDELRTAT